MKTRYAWSLVLTAVAMSLCATTLAQAAWPQQTGRAGTPALPQQPLGATVWRAQGTQTGSLSGPGSSFVRLYTDHKARQVGDVLTVIINETITGSARAAREHSNDTDAEVAPGVGYLGIIPALAHKASSSSSQSGNDTRSAGVTARVTVQVVEVTPQGNLIVEGTRTIVVGKDHQDIYVRGEVRPADISPDNIVYSHYLANAEIRCEGTDPRYPGTKVGLLTRIINWLF